MVSIKAFLPAVHHLLICKTDPPGSLTEYISNQYLKFFLSINDLDSLQARMTIGMSLIKNQIQQLVNYETSSLL